MTLYHGVWGNEDKKRMTGVLIKMIVTRLMMIPMLDDSDISEG